MCVAACGIFDPRCCRPVAWKWEELRFLATPTPTKHRLSRVTDSWTPQDRSTERKGENKGQQSRENKRKMIREEDARTIAT